MSSVEGWTVPGADGEGGPEAVLHRLWADKGTEDDEVLLVLWPFVVDNELIKP